MTLTDYKCSKLIDLYWIFRYNSIETTKHFVKYIYSLCWIVCFFLCIFCLFISHVSNLRISELTRSPRFYRMNWYITSHFQWRNHFYKRIITINFFLPFVMFCFVKIYRQIWLLFGIQFFGFVLISIGLALSSHLHFNAVVIYVFYRWFVCVCVCFFCVFVVNLMVAFATKNVEYDQIKSSSRHISFSMPMTFDYVIWWYFDSSSHPVPCTVKLSHHFWQLLVLSEANMESFKTPSSKRKKNKQTKNALPVPK